MKIVYDNFLGGLSPLDRRAPLNTYPVGYGIDPYRDIGHLKPGLRPVTITKSDDTPQIIDDVIVDMVVNFSSTAGEVFFIDNSDRLYRMTNLVTEAFDDDFDGSNHYYKAITSATEGHGVFIYPTKIGGATEANKLFYIYNTSSAGNIGMYDLSATFDDDWMSTIPTGAATLNKAPHPYMEWYDGLMYFGNGRYLASFDGRTGDNGTLNTAALDLPQGWEITALFSTPNYIGVCAWRSTIGQVYSGNRTESAAFLWNGVDSSFERKIPIADNYISSSFNDNGKIYLTTYGRQTYGVMRLLNENGSDIVAELRHGGVRFRPPHRNSMDTYQNRMIFGVLNNNEIFSYGQNQAGFPMALTLPWGVLGTSGVRAMKTVMYNKVFVSSYIAAGVKYLQKISSGDMNATWKPQYADFDERVKINYVKFYFKTLASGDSVTVALERNHTDEATSLGTITHASDGEVITKRFDKEISGLKCHAFRPTIIYLGGTVSFSKIVVDYSLAGDI